MYKKAAQMKLRFVFKGVIAVEDLFDLSMSQLDAIYRSLKQKHGAVSEGLLQESTPEDTVLTLQLKIVEDVFNTKREEMESKKAAADKRAKKERILEIMANKQDAKLQEMSLEELAEMVDSL